jgi:hypothetical protein
MKNHDISITTTKKKEKQTHKQKAKQGNFLLFNSILVYLLASLTSQRPITKLARVKKNKQNTHKIKYQCNLYMIINKYNISNNRKTKSSLRDGKTNIFTYIKY